MAERNGADDILTTTDVSITDNRKISIHSLIILILLKNLKFPVKYFQCRHDLFNNIFKFQITRCIENQRDKRSRLTFLCK